MSNNLNILVTGSSGFLGQHVVKLLQENDDSVKSLVCFDLKPYENKLGHELTKPMKIVQGDIRSEKDVSEAFQNIDCVINCACYFCIDLDLDENTLITTNVDGTKNLINCAIENNVKYFIQVSSITVACGNDPIFYSAENTIMIPEKKVLGSFANSKYQADLIVNKANGQDLKNKENKLRTVIIRPTLLYGENDKHFIPEMFKIAKECNKCLPRVDDTYTLNQVTYVGNAAWACIKAKNKLLIDPSIGGEDFFITDDTAITDLFDFAEPFLNSQGVKLSQKAMPFWLLYVFLNVFFFFVDLVKPFYSIKVSEKFNLRKLQYVTTTYFFNRTKAALRIDYYPLYDPEEAKKRSLNFYSKINFE